MVEHPQHLGFALEGLQVPGVGHLGEEELLERDLCSRRVFAR